MKKTGLKESLKFFSVDFNPIDTNNILDIHRYLMYGMFQIITKMFIVLLTKIVNASNHTKCVSLSNQKCKMQPTRINLHLNEYSQELHYYPFVVKLDECDGSCNTLSDFSNNLCVPNKTEYLNIQEKMNQKFEQNKYYANVNVNLIKENVIQIKSGITISVDASVKNITYGKNNVFGILLHGVVKMGDI